MGNIESSVRSWSDVRTLCWEYTLRLAGCEAAGAPWLPPGVLS